jgi:hypothetical protein
MILERRRRVLITTGPGDPEVEEDLRRLQYTPEERDRLFPPKKPFRLADWLAKAPPAKPEELEEMEELLRLRDAEREASLAQESGLSP